MKPSGHKILGTHEIARICHVTPPTAIRWIEEGKLPSFTTGGGHRRVWDKDLVAFMGKHNMPIPPELGRSGRLRILVVDDEADIRKLAGRVLAKQYPEAEILEAADGFEAGRLTATLLPDLILLDFQLPGVDGVRICQTIRADERLRGVKILAITGHNNEAVRSRMLAAGADDFLGKPFHVGELAEKTEKLLALKS